MVAAVQCEGTGTVALPIDWIRRRHTGTSWLSRVVRKGGRLMISDVHLMAVALGDPTTL